MKKRIKDTPIPINECSVEFYNLYHKYIDYYLGECKEESVYVKQEKLEKDIFRILLRWENEIIYFIGKAGIGKTTFIKKNFCRLDNGIEVDDEKEMIFVSLGFRGLLSVKDLEKFLINNLRGVCSTLEEKFEIKKKFYTDAGCCEFYDYIKRNGNYILENITSAEILGMSEIEEKKYRLMKAEEKETFKYIVYKMDFYLNNYCSHINKVVIVVDNIEAFSYDLRYEIIHSMLAMFSSMIDALKEINTTNIKIKLFLSMRNDSFEKLQEREDINAFYPYRLLYKEEPINMQSFLTLKKDLYMQSENNSDTSYYMIYEIFLELANKFERKYSYMIQNLCNYDLQQMKKCYKKILANKVWLLKGEMQRGIIDITKAETMFNNISVLRSIACGNNEVYRGEKSILVPNIFLNDEVNNDSMIALLVLSYLNRDREVIKKRLIFDIFADIFCNDEFILASLKRVINHFIRKEIVTEVYFEYRREERECYLDLTPRGKEIWAMLTADSVLLEMYREDYFFDEKKEQCNFVSSRKMMMTVGQDEIFLQLFDFIEELFVEEKKLHKIAIKNDKLEEYYSCFGKKAQVKRLLQGVVKSIEYAGKMYIYEIRSSIERLEEKIKKIDLSNGI